MTPFKEFIKIQNVDDIITYHLDNNIAITENILRPYSDLFFEFYSKIKHYVYEGIVELKTDFEQEIIETDIGEFGNFNGKQVPLDIPLLFEEEDKETLNKPRRGGSKKFYVYTKNAKGNVIKVSFGAKEGGGNLAVKINDKDARNAFAARHNCSQANDKTTPKYWACRLPRYAKALGLKVDNPSAWW